MLSNLPPSVIALLIANLLPILGLTFSEWSVFAVIFVYWLENAIIGVYNIFKMFLMGPQGVALIGFFTLHYGIFMTAHIAILCSLFFPPVAGHGAHTLEILDIYFPRVQWAFWALVASHGISFYFNFLKRKEYEGRNAMLQMLQPYKRILVMHFGLLLGGLLITTTHASPQTFLIFILGKVAWDLFTHLKEHALSPA